MIKHLSSVSRSILYAILFLIILLVMDKLYSLYNHYFSFQILTGNFNSNEQFHVLLFCMSIFFSTIPNKKIRIFIYTIIVFFSVVQYIHFDYFGKNIGAIEFYLFFTNIDETFGTLSTILGSIFIPFLIGIIGLFSLIGIDKLINNNKIKLKYWFLFLLSCMLLFNFKVYHLTNIKKGKLGHSASKLLYPNVGRHSAINFIISTNYFLFGILPKKLFGNSSEFEQLKKPILLNNDLKRTIVLIIGESLRADTFSLENNKLTPMLQTMKKDKGFFYKNIYSTGTMTKVSVSGIINRLKFPQGLEQISKEDNCIFRLAKENKFSTNFLSAQHANELLVLQDLICPKFIDNTIYRDDFKKYIEPTSYDEDLITVMEKLKLPKKNSLLVLQQRGSHSPYEKQYPKKYNKYTPYENTALYTDNTLFHTFKYIKQHVEGEFFIFYVSDHGELLGEYGKKGHGHLEKEVYTVPFLAYTNSQNKTILNQIQYIKNQYDISNYIDFLLGYKSELIRDEDRKMYILNSDLDGFSGYGVIRIKNGVELPIKKFNYIQ